MIDYELGYEERLKACFGLATATAFSTCALGAERLSVTRIQCNRANNGLSNPLPRENAWLLTMQLRACPSHELWIDGKQQDTAPLAAGTISIYDLRFDPRVNSISPFENLHFHLPMATLDAIAAREGYGPVTAIPNDPGIGLRDAVITGLAMAIAPSFDRPNQANQMFVDHVIHAIASYIAQRFSSGDPRGGYGRRGSSVRS